MRIRTTKPEYWRSSDTAQLTYLTRLLFIGLWNYVDDNGVGEDDEDLIRSDLFPRDDVQEASGIVRGGLLELSQRMQIVRYSDTRNGRKYLAVVNWKHQRIDKPTRSDKPHFTSEYAVLQEEFGSVLGGLPEDSRLYQGIKVPRDQGSVGPTPARPQPFCRKHMPDGTSEDCGGCARARKKAERWDADQFVVQAKAVSVTLAERENCGMCHGTNWVLDTDPAVRCHHVPVEAPGAANPTAPTKAGPPARTRRAGTAAEGRAQ